SAPKGLPGLFQKLTGRARRADVARQMRDAQRIEAAKDKLQALKAELRAEHAAFTRAQAKDREALTQRHGREDHQMTQTVAGREGADKAAERAARRERVQPATREREGPSRGREPG